MNATNFKLEHKLAALVLLAMAVALVLIASTAWAQRGDSSRRPLVHVANESQVRDMIDLMMEPKALDAGTAAMGGLSSNPYDYVKDNREYRKIVALGDSALPALEIALNESDENGIREYMICIAIEEITKCDLKRGGDNRWASAAEFRDAWPRFLDSVPERTEEILAGEVSIEEKQEQVEQLGRPAIPYVIDQRNHLSRTDELKMAATLCRLAGDATAGGTLDDFERRNARTVHDLRAYVEGR